MNLMGIGLLEMLVILLVAFLALGPSRSISMARTAGKVMNDLRSTFNDVAAAAGMDQSGQQPGVPQTAQAVRTARSNDQANKPEKDQASTTGDMDDTIEDAPTGEADPVNQSSAGQGASTNEDGHLTTDQATANQASQRSSEKQEPAD